LKDALNKQEVIDYYLSTIKDTYNDKLWILEVNIDSEIKNTSDVKVRSEFDLINGSTNENSKTADLEIRPVSIKNQKKGYYLVANVFSKPINTKNFIQFLKSKAIEASYFSNPTTNYEYVYLKYTINEQEVKDFYLSKLKGTYHEKLWILAVNIGR
jgi:hypothetical protein